MFHQSGAGKKKFLTEPVKIIPFPGQNLRDKVSPKKKVPVQPVVKTIHQTLKPEPKVLKTPSGKIPKSKFSIKKMMEKEQSQTSESLDLSNMPINDYDFDDFKIQWKQFAFKMKNQGKETFYNALIKREPVRKEEDLFILEVDNQVQVDYITPIMPDLLDFIRGNLKNYSINVKLEITKNPEEDVKFLTGKDKFAALARKNPNLHTLKNLFDLDIDF